MIEKLIVRSVNLYVFHVLDDRTWKVRKYFARCFPSEQFWSVCTAELKGKFLALFWWFSNGWLLKNNNFLGALKPVTHIPVVQSTRLYFYCIFDFYFYIKDYLKIQITFSIDPSNQDQILSMNYNRKMQLMHRPISSSNARFRNETRTYFLPNGNISSNFLFRTIIMRIFSATRSLRSRWSSFSFDKRPYRRWKRSLCIISRSYFISEYILPFSWRRPQRPFRVL